MTHPVDTHVGNAIRSRRWMLGLTQQQLAQSVGIRFQQVQKYETAANRVSASRLYEISRAMDTDVSFFFEGLETSVNEQDGTSETVSKPEARLFTDKEGLEFIRCYYNLPEGPRKRLYELTRSLSDAA